MTSVSPPAQHRQIINKHTGRLLIARIRIQILLLHLPPNVHIVAKLALGAFLAFAYLVERTEHRLRIDAERDLLHLDCSEQIGILLCAPLVISFRLGLQGSLLLLLDRCAGFAGHILLLLDHGDVLLHFCRLVFLWELLGMVLDIFDLAGGRAYVLHPKSLFWF